MEYFFSASCDHSSCVLVKCIWILIGKAGPIGNTNVFSIIFKLIRRISVVIGSLTERESARRGEFARWTVVDD